MMSTDVASVAVPGSIEGGSVVGRRTICSRGAPLLPLAPPDWPLAWQPPASRPKTTRTVATQRDRPRTLPSRLQPRPPGCAVGNYSIAGRGPAAVLSAARPGAYSIRTFLDEGTLAGGAASSQGSWFRLAGSGH